MTDKIVNLNEYSMKTNPKWIKAEDTDLMIAGSITACSMHLNLISQYLNNTGRLAQSQAIHTIVKFLENEAISIARRVL